MEKWGGLLDILMVCVGGGFNVMGLFYEFMNDVLVWMIGVEAVGEGVNISKYVVILIFGCVGVLYGVMSYLL